MHVLGYCTARTGYHRLQRLRSTIYIPTVGLIVWNLLTFNAHQEVIGEMFVSDNEELSGVWWRRECRGTKLQHVVKLMIQRDWVSIRQRTCCWRRHRWRHVAAERRVRLLRPVDQEAVHSTCATAPLSTRAGPRGWIGRWREVEHTDGDALSRRCVQLPRLSVRSTASRRLQCLDVDRLWRRYRHRACTVVFHHCMRKGKGKKVKSTYLL